MACFVVAGATRGSASPAEVSELSSLAPSDSVLQEASEPLVLPPSGGTRVPIIRVAVASHAASVEVASSFGAWIGRHRSGHRPSRIDGAEVWRIEATDSGVAVRDGAGRLRGACRDTLYVYPMDRESGLLQLQGREYRGELLVWRGADGLTVSTLRWEPSPGQPATYERSLDRDRRSLEAAHRRQRRVFRPPRTRREAPPAVPALA